jgi:hypothetical protein
MRLGCRRRTAVAKDATHLAGDSALTRWFVCRRRGFGQMQRTRVARLHQRVSASKASGQTPPRVPCPRPSLLSYVTLCALCSNARVARTFTTAQGRASAGVSSCLLANRCLPALPHKTQCEGSKTRSPSGHRLFVNTRLARHVSRVPSCSTCSAHPHTHSACLPFLNRKRAATVNSRTSMDPSPQTGAGLSSRATRHVPCYLPSEPMQ